MGYDGQHATLGELCLRNAHERGDDLAVVDDESKLTYAQLAEAARRAAGALAEAGIRPGHRVQLSGPNSVGWVAAALGISLAGAVIVPVNDRFTVDELRRLGSGLPPDAVVSDDVDGSAAVAAPETAVRLTLDQLLGWAGTLAALPEVRADDLALVMHTSGTTGAPKSVPMRHGPLLAVYTELSRRIGLTRRDVLLGSAPLVHGFGLFGVLLNSLLAGSCVRLVRRYDRDRIADLVADAGITAVFAPPTVFHDLVASGRRDLGTRCRIALTGGTEISLTQFHDLCDALGVPQRMVGYGMTEAYGAVAFADVTDQRAEPLPVLTALDAVEVRIAGSWSPEPQGPAEILVRGASVVTGPDEWLHTGDLAQLTEDGRFTVVARVSDTVMVSGFTVNPLEVEDVLRAHAGVQEAVVVGVPHPRSGQALVGCVVMEPGARFDSQALRRASRDRLAPYKVPVEFVELNGFPTTQTGKRSRTALRDLVIQKHGQAAESPASTVERP